MRRSLVLLTFLAAAGLAADVVPAEVVVAGCDAPADQADAVVTSFDETPIAVTVFRPAGVCVDAPTPVVLTLHGWAGSRSTSVDAGDVAPFVGAGYGVVAIDARGHGDSGGQALVHHPSREVRDFQAVLDWIHDELDWVARDPAPRAPKDVVAGAYGGSYGGGFQLMTAAYDDRLDALVPMATWNSLPDSLAPNRGAIKSDWLTLLYAAGETQARLDPLLGEWYRDTMRENAVPHEGLHSFTESSPAHRMAAIDVPALLIQGLPDTLFNLNQAVANYRGIRANGITDVRLVGVNSGHELPALQPGSIGHEVRTVDSPCVDVEALAVDFLDTHLRGDADAAARLAAVPRVALATEQDGCVAGDDWPLADTARAFTFPVVAAPNPAGSLLLPLFTAEEEVTLAGIPTLVGTPVVEVDDLLYLSLVVRDAAGLHVVDDQVTGVRIRPGCLAGELRSACAQAGPVQVDLGGVATTLQPGQELLLRVDGANEQHVLNGNRRPGAGLLTAVTLTLPVVSGAPSPS